MSKEQLIAEDQVKLYELLTKKEKKPKKDYSERYDRLAEYGVMPMQSGLAGLSAREAADALSRAMHRAAAPPNEAYHTGGYSQLPMHGRLHIGESTAHITIETIEMDSTIETTTMADGGFRSFLPGPVYMRGKLKAPTELIHEWAELLMQQHEQYPRVYLMSPEVGNRYQADVICTDVAVNVTIDSLATINFTLQVSGALIREDLP